MLVYDASTSKWRNSGITFPSIALTGLSDLAIASPSLQQIISYDASTSKWRNSGLTFPQAALTGLSDLNISSPIAQQTIVYDASANKWKNSGIPAFNNRLSGLLDVNVGGSGIGSIIENSGGTWIASPALNELRRSYLTGVYDVTYHGISNLGNNITTALQTFLTNLPNNTTVRIPAGNYFIDSTIELSGKINVNFEVSPQAKFVELNRLNRGDFWFTRCSGINWRGGEISGADTLTYILQTASGIELSGSQMENLASGPENGESVRTVIGQAFTTHLCGDSSFRDIKIYGKYRAVDDYFGNRMSWDRIYHVGVHTGALSRLIETIVSGTVQQGDIYKETERTTYTFSLGRTKKSWITNCFSRNCGGLLVAGTPSMGVGADGLSTRTQDINMRDCISQNAYDNGVYFSSAEQILCQGIRVMVDNNLPHTITAMKARGAYIVFDNCYAQHCHHGFGLEGMGAVGDYWTTGHTAGWSSQGSRISNCVAVDCATIGIYLDANNSVNPRDVIIENNYLYNCGLGPYGRSPTGYLAAEVGNYNAAILADDGLRVKIVNNTIEFTGNIAPDFAIVVGATNAVGPWITGCDISNNKILGAKRGIAARGLSNAKICNNYGERMGYYGFEPVVAFSGTPCLIYTDEIKDSRIYDNQITPTGHCVMIYTTPNSTFSNVKRRDNDGYEVIN